MGDEVINTTSPKANIRLYPNPAKQRVTVDFGNAEFETASVEFYDVMGRMAHQEGLNFTSGNAYEIDLESLISGLYLVRIVLDHEITSELKLVVE